ncbi:hypothetical protein [Limosilactobacillus agrestimuris]|uniref:hypothetical protein n=1 Tax=Limosilactobacillus agrestimuris TaxID=2941331 RepID=UPI0020413E59|nr:hypothetical protein [Limosilactobacillus agrestimuris]
MRIGVLNVVNKQLIGKLSVVGLALLLAGCGAQSANSNSTSGSSGSSAIANNQKVNLDSTNMPPQEVSSLVTIYSSKKYGGDWAKAARGAENNGLRTNLYDTSDYSLDNPGATGEDGSGILYNAGPEKNSADVAYTLNQDGSINIYENVKKGEKAKKLGTVSQNDMVYYINQHNQASQVQNLTKKSKVYDERSGRNNVANHEFGRQAVFTTPKSMRGVWYSDDGNQETVLTIREHTITVSTNNNSTKSWLYKQYPDFLSSPDAQNKTVQAQTQTWQSAKYVNAHNKNWLNIRGWCDTQNKGQFYLLHHEKINGKETTVLVSANGDNVTTDNVFYTNQSTAQKQANHHYADLDYPQSPEGEDEVNN